MPYLRVVRGPEPGRIFELTDDVVTIGRGRKNTIIIHDNEISREHCRLVKVLFDYEISDLNSTNGTFINGRPVGETSSTLADKNIIELGDSIVLEYLLTLDASSAEPTTPPPSQADMLAPEVDVSMEEGAPLPTEGLSEAPPLAATAPATNFYLVIRRRSQFMPEVYLLDSPLVDVGRHLDNAICLSEAQVSRFHLRLNRLNDGYTLEDLGSMNGTFINGVRVEKSVALSSGDYITIGHTVEMWFTHNLETLRMVPNIRSQQAPVRSSTDAPVKPEASTAQPAPAPAEPLPQTTLLNPSALGALSVEPSPTLDVEPEPTEATEHMPAQNPPESAPPSDASASAAVRGLLNAAAAIMPAAPLTESPKPADDEIAKSTKTTEEAPNISALKPPSEAEPDTPSEQ